MIYRYDEIEGSVGGNEVYKDRIVLVLVYFFNLYSKLGSISIDIK